MFVKVAMFLKAETKSFAFKTSHVARCGSSENTGLHRQTRIQMNASFARNTIGFETIEVVTRIVPGKF